MSEDQSESVVVESSTFKQPKEANNNASASEAPPSTVPKSSGPQTDVQESSTAVDKKIDLFQIHIESNPRNTLVFKGGDLVKGTIVMTLSEALDVESLDLDLVGGALAGWKVTSPNEPGKSAEKEETEYYVKASQNILGILPGENLLVSKGTHKFRFSFRLPLGVPASFHGTYGYVNYVLKATLRTNIGTNMYVAKVQVQQYLDTPNYLKFLAPAEVRVKKNYLGKGIKSMFSGPVEAVFAISRMGFTFGEPIEINGHVLNRSYSTVKSIKANLVQHCNYLAQGARISESSVVKSVEDAFDVQRNAIRRWKDVKMVVPEDCAPSYLDGCQLLETYYEIAFVVTVKGGKPLVAVLPVVIGLASLQHTAEARIERQRSSAPVSPSIGTLKTQVFDYGTIYSSPDTRNSQYSQGNGVDAESQPEEQQQRLAQRQVKQYDENLE